VVASSSGLKLVRLIAQEVKRKEQGIYSMIQGERLTSANRSAGSHQHA